MPTKRQGKRIHREQVKEVLNGQCILQIKYCKPIHKYRVGRKATFRYQVIQQTHTHTKNKSPNRKKDHIKPRSQ